MEYEYVYAHQTMYSEQIAAISILTTVVIGMLLWYRVKNMPEIMDRDYSRELPGGWFRNLASIIVKNSQKKEILSTYESYVWNCNGFELEANFEWQDFYDGIDAFDLPIPMSATITIVKKGMLYKKECMIAILDRNNYRVIGYDNYNYEEEYKERIAKRPELRVRGREVLS